MTYNVTIILQEVTTNCRGTTGSRDTETNLDCKAGSLVHIAHEKNQATTPLNHQL
jgi:hypothetical protein